MGNPLSRILSRRRENQTVNRQRFTEQELVRLRNQKDFGRRLSTIEAATKQIAEGKLGLEEAERIKGEINNIQKVVPGEVHEVLLNRLNLAVTKAAHQK